MIYIFRKEIKKWHSVLWVVVASLAFSSVASVIYWHFRNPYEQIVARVNGEMVSYREYQRERQKVQMTLDNFRQYAQSQNVPIDLFLRISGLDNPLKTALDNCIRQALLRDIQRSLPLQLDADYLNDAILRNLPLYVTNPDGSVNTSAYQSYLARRNLTISEYEQSIEEQSEQAVINQCIERAYYLPDYSVMFEVAQQYTRKKFAVAHFSFDTFLTLEEKVAVSQDSLHEYYRIHKQDYRIPEKRKARYWRVRSEQYKEQVQVSPENAQRFYEKNKTTLYRIPPKVKLRHILIKKGNDTEKSLEKAEKLHTQLLNEPETFAEIAQKESDDKKTAPDGGLIDFFEKGTYNAVFEKYAFRLKNKGEISPVITTPEGYSLLKLEERITTQYKPFDAVREQIVEAIKAKKTLRIMKTDVQALVKKTGQSPKHLQDFVKRFELKEQKTDWLTKKTSDSQSLIDKLKEKLFTLEDQQTQAFAYQDDYILVQHSKTEPSSIPTFEEKKDSVQKDYYADKAAKALQKAVAEVRESFFNKNIPFEKAVTTFHGTLTQTSLSKPDESLGLQDVPDYLTSKAFELFSDDQLLHVHDKKDSYLVHLIEQEDTYVSDKEALNNHRAKKEQQEQANYVPAFIASLLKEAKIVRNEKFFKQIPQ